MAPFGKLYAYEGNPRTTGLLVVAKENNLDIELVRTHPGEGVSTDYKKLNKLGRIPTFEGADGYILSEMLAIAVYFTSQNEKTTLLGKTKQDYASILRWMSFANAELLVPMGGWFRPLLGKDPYNKKNVEDSQKRANEGFKVMEDHLMINTFLVGERLSLADIIAAGIVSRGMELVLDKSWRMSYPSVTRWFETVANQPNYKSVNGGEGPKLADEAIKYTPPAKEKAPKQEQKKKEEPKPKKKEVDEEEEEDAPAPKPKHPLEELPKASVPIDEWKRKFKNEETREVALPWLWENMPLGEEYSLWKVEYKYPEELTQVFMTSNLVTGFFTRLEGSRKYIMGCASVYGEKDNNFVQGAFIIRGQEYQSAFDVAPDWESYNFTKLDPKKAEDKEFFENMMAWDKPATLNGKTAEHADGKIFV